MAGMPNMRDVIKELNQYFGTMSDLKEQWEQIETDRDVYRITVREGLALADLRLAFYDATKDRNDISHVRHATVDFIHECCQKWVKQQHEPGCFYPANAMPCSCSPRRDSVEGWNRYVAKKRWE